jgi:phenylpropionate dioxygenase-like ring-hydroxylating dioxygenase large terminal subunit
VALGRWGGWIWINQDAQPEPLEEYLRDVARFLDPFAPADMRPLWWKTIVAPANWKVLVGAFIEAYHSGATHVSGINYRNARVPSLALGDHAMLYGEPGPFTE